MQHQGAGRALLPLGVWGGRLPASFCFWGLPAFLGSWRHHSNLCPCYWVVSCPVSMPASFCLFKGAHHWGEGPPSPGTASLELDYMCPDRVAPRGPGEMGTPEGAPFNPAHQVPPGSFSAGASHGRV